LGWGHEPGAFRSILGLRLGKSMTDLTNLARRLDGTCRPSRDVPSGVARRGAASPPPDDHTLLATHAQQSDVATCTYHIRPPRHLRRSPSRPGGIPRTAATTLARARAATYQSVTHVQQPVIATRPYHSLPTAAPPTSTDTSVRHPPYGCHNAGTRTGGYTPERNTRITQRHVQGRTQRGGVPRASMRTDAAAAKPSVAFNRGPSRTTHTATRHTHACCIKGYVGTDQG
jgi:hypothetical protein